MKEEIKIPHLLSEIEYQKLSPFDKEAYIKEILRKTLAQNPYGVTISQLNRHLKFDRRIIEKHLEIMKFTNELYTIQVGSSILYIPNHKAMHEATSQTIRLGNYEYQINILKNRLGDFVVIQQKNINKQPSEINGALQIPLKDYKEFVMYIRKSLVDIERRGFM